MNPWLIGAALLYLGGSWAWKKYIAKPPPIQPADRQLSSPLTEEGAAVPLVFGRCRVRSPILTWIGDPHVADAQTYFTNGDISVPVAGDLYACSMFFTVGQSFPDGTNKIHSMWIGERKCKDDGIGPIGIGIGTVRLNQLEGGGNFEDEERPCYVETRLQSLGTAIGYAGGYVEFLNGNSSQQLVDPEDPFGPTTVAGRYMTVNNGTGIDDLQGRELGEHVPGFRGFMSVMLYNLQVSDLDTAHWSVGAQPQVEPYSFEVSSYPASGTSLTTFPGIGLEANPADALMSILTTRLGISTDDIDVPSFVAAATTLYGETHGYSRAIEEDTTAEEVIGGILTQIHGVMYVDTTTGKLVIKLLRPDYNPPDLPVFDKNNTDKIEVDAIGRTDLPNKIRVSFRDRSLEYAVNSVAVMNQADVFTTGKVREEQIDMPGVCTKELATAIANRELHALSRPLMTASVTTKRSALRLNPGDPVMLRMSSPDVSNIVFRVTNVDRGTLEDGAIRFDLIQDENYVWRMQAPRPPIGALPRPGGVGVRMG